MQPTSWSYVPNIGLGRRCIGTLICSILRTQQLYTRWLAMVASTFELGSRAYHLASAQSVGENIADDDAHSSPCDPSTGKRKRLAVV